MTSIVNTPEMILLKRAIFSADRGNLQAGGLPWTEKSTLQEVPNSVDAWDRSHRQ
jgi:hypothetical protein